MNGLDPALLPAPDGSFDAGDRLHLLGLYSGIPAAPPGGFVFKPWYARGANVILVAGSPV